MKKRIRSFRLRQLSYIHIPQFLTYHHSKPGLHIWWTPQLYWLTRSLLSRNLAISIFVSFAVSVHTSIPKQLPPSPLPFFTLGLTTTTLFVTTCPSLRSPGSNQQIQNSLARAVVKAPKSSHITPILRSLHWLKITERIEYNLLSLTYKVLTTTQPSYLHNLITVQPPRSTRSSSLVTFVRPQHLFYK